MATRDEMIDAINGVLAPMMAEYGRLLMEVGDDQRCGDLHVIAKFEGMEAKIPIEAIMRLFDVSDESEAAVTRQPTYAYDEWRKIAPDSRPPFDEFHREFTRKITGEVVER